MKRSVRQRTVAVLAILVMAFSFALIPSPAYAASTGKVKVSVTQDYQSVQTMLKLINQRRKKAGLRAVTLDKKLTNAAIQRAAEVAVCVPSTSPHRRPNGSLVRTLNSRINYEICAESSGNYSEADIVKGWMASPPHKKGILLKSARSAGIACVTTGLYDQVWIIDFSNSAAKPRLRASSRAVEVSKTVKAKSAHLKKKYFSLRSYYDGGPGDSIQLDVGETLTVMPCLKSPAAYSIASLAPAQFTWTSSNPAVAIVSAKGMVTPLAPGKAIITATMKGRTAVQMTKTVEVYGD